MESTTIHPCRGCASTDVVCVRINLARAESGGEPLETQAARDVSSSLENGRRVSIPPARVFYNHPANPRTLSLTNTSLISSSLRPAASQPLVESRRPRHRDVLAILIAVRNSARLSSPLGFARSSRRSRRSRRKKKGARCTAPHVVLYNARSCNWNRSRMRSR